MYVFLFFSDTESFYRYFCFIHGVFFFQAEDGIRDYKVTGVQTCALPICAVARRAEGEGGRAGDAAERDVAVVRAIRAGAGCRAELGSASAAVREDLHDAGHGRSEERRVGKGGGGRRGPDRWRKTTGEKVM